MKSLAFAALATLALSGTAFAADLAPRPVEPIAPVYLPFSWTGFYIGLNAVAPLAMSTAILPA